MLSWIATYIPFSGLGLLLFLILNFKRFEVNFSNKLFVIVIAFFFGQGFYFEGSNAFEMFSIYNIVTNLKSKEVIFKPISIDETVENKMA